MYKSMELTAIPKTLNQLGDPVQVNQSNSNLREAQPAINYALRVRLNTARDIGVGKFVDIDAGAGYPGQPKLCKNTLGMYALSYVGIDSIYSNNLTSDLETDSWVDASGVGSFSTRHKYYEMDPANTPFHEVRRDLGYGNIFTEDNDFILRFTFSLPENDIYGRFGFGASDGSGATGTSGIWLEPKGTTPETYTARIYDGVISSTPYGHGTLSANVTYTVDMVHRASDNYFIARFYDPNGYVFSVSDTNVFSGRDADNITIFSPPSTHAPIETIKVFGVEAWVRNVIVKKSIDNCKTWSKTLTNPVAIGNLVTESSVALDDEGNIYLVWVEYNGTPANYFHIFYSVFDGDSWTTAEQLDTVSTNHDRLNPNIVMGPLGIPVGSVRRVHMCWRKDTTVGNPDIQYVYKDI